MESFDAVLRTLLARIRALDAARAQALRTSASADATRPRYRVAPTRWGALDAEPSPDVRSLLRPPAKRGTGGGGPTGGAAAVAGDLRGRHFRLPEASGLPAPRGLLSCELPGDRGRRPQASDSPRR